MRGTMERMYSDLMDGLTFTVFECNSDGYWRAGRRGLGSSVAGVNGYSSGLINEQFFPIIRIKNVSVFLILPHETNEIPVPRISSCFC